MNEQVFKETIANEFPDEDMLDKTFRDKVMMMIMSVTLVLILTIDQAKRVVILALLMIQTQG